MTENTPSPSTTPNVVLQNPHVRKVAGIVIGAAAIIVPAAVVLDTATDAFDWSAWTYPATMLTSFLAGVFQVSVSTPNVPRV